MPTDVELIKDRIDLAELVRERVRLTRSGRHWKGRCPFHDDRSPSFFVFDDQRYFCFGCKAKGNAFDWVMQTEHVAFVDALKMLADIAGVTLTGGRQAASSDDQRIREALEAAQAFFRSQFESSAEAKAFAESRGLDFETCLKWEIGYAPDFEEGLIRHLRAARVPLAIAQTAGLVSGDESQGYRDFFIGRLMFPIRDEKGKLSAFGGRLIGQGEPKYLNSREIAGVFAKNRTLYGLNKAKPRIAEIHEAVICEGYMDVIACHKAGITQAVAPLGTSFTTHHARRLKRMCETVILAFDGDGAGVSAAVRTADLCAGEQLAVRIARMPEGQDPDVVLRSLGAEHLRQIVSQARSPLRFEVETMAAKAAGGPIIEDPAFWKQLARLLAHGDPIEAEMLIVEISARHPSAAHDRNAASRAVRLEVERLRPKPKKMKAAQNAPLARSLDLPDGPERPVLRAALHEEYREMVWEALAEPGLIVSEQGRKLADALIEQFEEPPKGDQSQVVSCLDGEALEVARALDRPADHIYDRPAEGELRPSEITSAIEILREERKRREELEKFRQTGDLSALNAFLSSKTSD
jgi:DNA primase